MPICVFNPNTYLFQIFFQIKVLLLTVPVKVSRAENVNRINFPVLFQFLWDLLAVFIFLAPHLQCCTEFVVVQQIPPCNSSHMSSVMQDVTCGVELEIELPALP